MSYLEKTLIDYINNPIDFWEGNTRQAGKSINRFSQLVDYYSWPTEYLVRLIIAAARERVNANVPTIYISSFGSSGSHLLQHVLVNALGFIGLGEIYLPPKFEQKMGESDKETNKLLIECYHLIHSIPVDVFSKKQIINTAHKAKLQGFSENTNYFKSALLVRNPIDLTISRTFRKNEYREYLNKGKTSDEDYFFENLMKTKKFYKAALNHSYDQYFTYEELLSCNYELVSRITDLANSQECSSEVYESLVDAVNVGASNKYNGPDIEIKDHFYALAEKELKPILDKMRESSLLVE